MGDSKHIIFFDGNCMLCNSFISLMAKKKIRSLFFCDINSSMASQILADYSFTNLPQNTIYFFTDNKLYSKSTAVLKILGLLGPISKISARFLLIFPVFMRDGAYTLVAKNRYRFLKKTSCYKPTAEEQKMFL